MTEEHPITPSPELVRQLWSQCSAESENLFNKFATLMPLLWGADELEAPVVHLSSITDMPPTLTCNLTYFKKTGKFYDKGSFDVAATHQLFEIWEHVRARRDEGRLPGLVDGAGREFMVLVDVPGHPHEHPHLIV